MLGIIYSVQLLHTNLLGILARWMAPTAQLPTYYLGTILYTGQTSSSQREQGSTTSLQYN